jgi:ribosomal-protein-alanine N-acetyltransferase
LEVRESNRPATALYERYGFVKTAVRKGYYSDGGDAALYTFKISGKLKAEN